jgi:hypothetical protein
MRHYCVTLKALTGGEEMSYTMKCFRSGNTLRVSLLAGLRYKLNAQAGDVLRAEENLDGSFELTNLSHEHRIKQLRKKK